MTSEQHPGAGTTSGGLVHPRLLSNTLSGDSLEVLQRGGYREECKMVFDDLNGVLSKNPARCVQPLYAKRGWCKNIGVSSHKYFP